MVSERKCYTVQSKEKGMTGTKYIPVRIVSIGFEFQFHGAFRSNNHEKKNRIERASYIVYSELEGMTSEMSLSGRNCYES